MGDRNDQLEFTLAMLGMPYIPGLDRPNSVMRGKPPDLPHFDGPAETCSGLDRKRLSGQLGRVHALMAAGRWLTLSAIAGACGCPEGSASARLRDLRKERFGGFDVQRRSVGNGLHEYRIAARDIETGKHGK